MHPSARSIADVDVDLAPFNLPRQQAVADDADGESVEAMLLRILEQEENISGFPSFSTKSQVCALRKEKVLSGNEHGPPVISGSHLQNLRPPNYVWDPDASASSLSLRSENTFVPSMTLDDEYFDPEALLRELAPSTEVSPRGSHQHLVEPHQHLVEPPPSGSLGGSSSSNKNKNPLVIKIEVSISVPSRYIGGLNHTHPPAVASVEELPVGASKEQGLLLQRRQKRGRSSLQLEGRSSKVSRRLA